MNIEALVHQAFSNTQPPGGALFSTANDEGAAHVFTGARWEHIGHEQLTHHSAAINFLAPEAFAYFLPAFILASSHDPGVRDSLLLKLLPPKGDLTRPSFATWWQRLTPLQKNAVVSFVECCREADSSLDSAAFEALKHQGGPNTSLERTRDR